MCPSRSSIFHLLIILLFAPLQGIGNSFQGGANCIMFVLCTRVIRTRLLKSLCWCCFSSPTSGDVRGSAISEGYPPDYGSTSGFLDRPTWSPHQPSTWLFCRTSSPSIQMVFVVSDWMDWTYSDLTPKWSLDVLCVMKLLHRIYKVLFSALPIRFFSMQSLSCTIIEQWALWIKHCLQVFRLLH